MEQKKLGDVTVNDGKGLLDNEGMIDMIIVSCNSAVKELLAGQYINFCSKMGNIAQMLLSLKKGVRDDMDAMQKKVDELKRIVDELTAEKGE